MPIIPELRRLSQKDNHELEASLGYITSTNQLAWGLWLVVVIVSLVFIWGRSVCFTHLFLKLENNVIQSLREKE